MRYSVSSDMSVEQENK